jgi:hypothetical protein
MIPYAFFNSVYIKKMNVEPSDTHDAAHSIMACLPSNEVDGKHARIACKSSPSM